MSTYKVNPGNVFVLNDKKYKAGETVQLDPKDAEWGLNHKAIVEAEDAPQTKSASQLITPISPQTNPTK